MAFVIIVRRSVPEGSDDWETVAAKQAAEAKSAGCSAVRVLRSEAPTRDLFAVSDWTSRAEAVRYIEATAAADPSLVVSPGHIELRGGGGAFHMILLEQISGEAANSTEVS